MIRCPRQRLKGLMHVSMSYKGIRKTPGAQASGVFDFGTACGRLCALLGTAAEAFRALGHCKQRSRDWRRRLQGGERFNGYGSV